MINMSLSVRVVLLVLVTSTILAGGMLLTVYQLMISDYTASVVDRETSEIERLVTEVDLVQQQRVLGLEAFAARLLNSEGQLRSEQELSLRLQQPSVAHRLFPDGLLVFDAEATAIAENIYVPGRLGTNYADRPHFQRARETKEAVISPPIIGRTTGLPLISYVQPMLSAEGEIIGFTGGTLNLANTAILGTPVLDATTESSQVINRIIDPQHRLFVSLQKPIDSLEPLPAVGSDTLVDAALSMVENGTIVDYQQQRYLVFTRALESVGWVALRALPVDDAVAPAKRSFYHFLLISSIAIVLVGLLGVWIARGLTRPIEIMTRRIEQMADNAHFDSNFSEQGGKEVRLLARAMNRLATERNAADKATREAERFLANVLEAASEMAVIATDTNGIITVFNQGAVNMLGYRKTDVVGKYSPALFHLTEEVEARSVQLSSELGQTVEGFKVFVAKPEQHGAEKREWTYVHKDGHYVPVSLVVTPMRNDEGHISGYLGVADDITERKRADKLKNEFISTVSHELRTPLTSISGALGLLVGGAFGELPDKAKKLLDTAHRNSKRLAHLINDLLDIEKIASGKLHFDMQVQPLMPLVEQALESNRHYSSDKGVALVLAQEPDQDVQVRVDSQRLMQVLSNLLSNAIKFSPNNDKVLLHVEVVRHKVVVSVVDHGPGISDAFRSRIFQRFAQADASDTRAKDGTGLGLAITKELVEHMSGRIGFESTEGEGSRFFFELPLAQLASVAVSPPEEGEGHRQSARILVVEDDQDVAQLLSMMLSDAGYNVDVAFCGTDALNTISNHHYDLVSLDLMLPDISGLEIIRRLREHPSTADLPIVVVSAKVEQGRLEINGDVGNIDWLAKPIDQQRLIGIVKQQLLEKQSHIPRVLHVEDDEDLHEVVSVMVGTCATFESAHTFEDAKRCIEQQTYDVVLLDIGLPDGSGWDLVPIIRYHLPEAKVIILSGADMNREHHEQVEAVLLKSRLSADTLLQNVAVRVEAYQPSKNG